MKTKKEQILEKAISYELSMSCVYYEFEKLFTQDAEFWKKLSDEEKEHAQIIRKFIPFIDLDDEVSEDFASISLIKLKENIEFNDNIILNLTKDTKREFAFKTALDLESKASEVHYRKLLNSEKETKIVKIFQTLNNEDKRHFQRIQDYINSVNIKI